MKKTTLPKNERVDSFRLKFGKIVTLGVVKELFKLYSTREKILLMLVVVGRSGDIVPLSLAILIVVVGADY